jgi:hypothetical protein
LVTWRFTSLDPATGQLPEDPLLGFLPPNANPPEGEGSVLFSVMPKGGLGTGSEIRNQATIVFDVNPPIATNEWWNTIDQTMPDSQVLPLAATQSSPSFTVGWTGADAHSGVLDYWLYVSEDGGPFAPWLILATGESEMFTGEPGKSYAFYSLARDNVGNVQSPPAVPDAVTTVLESQLRQLTGLSPAKVWVGLKNSDDVGTRFDLKAEVYVGGAMVGSGQLDGVAGGSSSFRNARLNSIPLTLSGPVAIEPGSLLSITLSVRNTCWGRTHNRGRARLWFNDSQADSEFDATIDGVSSNYYLRSGSTLDTTPGPGPRSTIDVLVSDKAACPTRPFTPFGTWSIALP